MPIDPGWDVGSVVTILFGGIGTAGLIAALVWISNRY